MIAPSVAGHIDIRARRLSRSEKPARLAMLAFPRSEPPVPKTAHIAR